jgi:hypothetical protein
LTSPSATSAALPSNSLVNPPDAALPPSVAGPAITSRKIPAGPAPNGTWTVAFSLERVPGDQNLDWSTALALCKTKGKALCLETQWQRACELDSTIGSTESWTLTADYPGAAVRGGVDGCKSRVFRKITEKNQDRIGLCCDRVVAITSDDKSDDFRTLANNRVVEFESAVLAQQQSPEAISKIISSKLSLDGIDFDRDVALTKLLEPQKVDPDRIAFFDHCNVKLSDEDGSQKLLADCGVILRSSGKTRGFAQRIAFNGTNGPVVYWGDPKAMKPREQKERIRAFLPSE